MADALSAGASRSHLGSSSMIGAPSTASTAPIGSSYHGAREAAGVAGMHFSVEEGVGGVSFETRDIVQNPVSITKTTSGGDQLGVRLNTSTQGKVTEKFEELKGLIGEYLIRNGDLTGREIEILEMDVDVNNGIITWGRAGDLEDHHIDLHVTHFGGGDAAIRKAEGELRALLVQSRISGCRETPRSFIGDSSSGHSSTSIARLQAPIQSRLASVTAKDFAVTHIKDFMDVSVVSNPTVRKSFTKDIGIAEIHREHMIQFIKAQLGRRTAELRQIEESGAPSMRRHPDVVQLKKEIHYLSARYKELVNDDRYALYSTLAGRYVAAGRGTPQQKADRIYEKIAANMHKGVGAVQAKRLWVFNRTAELTRECHIYAREVAALSIGNSTAADLSESHRVSRFAYNSSRGLSTDVNTVAINEAIMPTVLAAQADALGSSGPGRSHEGYRLFEGCPELLGDATFQRELDTALQASHADIRQFRADVDSVFVANPKTGTVDVDKAAAKAMARFNPKSRL